MGCLPTGIINKIAPQQRRNSKGKGATSSLHKGSPESGLTPGKRHPHAERIGDAGRPSAIYSLEH